MYCNILDYGAVADCHIDNSSAIMQAINDCAAHGGGTVNIPPGVFGSKKIVMQDNIELHFEYGAELYSLLEQIPAPDKKCDEPSQNTKQYLIGGEKLKNVSVTGRGTVNGRGYDIFWPKNDGLEHPLFGQRFWPQLHRPKGLIHFRECTDVLIENITILDPPCYNIWCLGCDRVIVQNVKIITDLRGPNNDGVDIDCCSNVQISNCDIICSDDGIAIKSDTDELGYDKACENITISDCRIKTTSDGIRIGYEGDGAIRNITMTNCVIYDTMIGISMMVAISPNDIRGCNIYNGPAISDITFSNLVINAFTTFNFQYTKPRDCADTIKGFIDRVTFRNIVANATRGSYLGAYKESPFRNIEFSDIYMTLSGEMGDDFLEKVPDPYPLWCDLPYSGIPYPFFIRHAENIVIRNSTFAWQNASGVWQSDIVKTENANVTLENNRKINPPKGK